MSPLLFLSYMISTAVTALNISSPIISPSSYSPLSNVLDSPLWKHRTCTYKMLKSRTNKNHMWVAIWVAYSVWNAEVGYGGPGRVTSTRGHNKKIKKTDKSILHHSYRIPPIQIANTVLITLPMDHLGTRTTRTQHR